MVIFMWKKFISSDHGTLFQLFALIKRLTAANNPKKDMNACTDARHELKGYFLAFTCKELGIENINSDLEHPIYF